MMTRATLVSVLLLGACADAALDRPDPVCDDAADVLVECGKLLDMSLFGSCLPEQRELAETVLEVHRDVGCAGLADAKADSAICTLVPFLCVDHTVDELAPFVTDGCSMFPDGPQADPTKWQQCCVTHDFAYYKGGPSEAREAADLELQGCLLDASHRVVADLVYYGFWIAGTPVLPTPWRWGYGWAYDPLDGYRTLPAAQTSAAQARIDAYRADPVPPAAFEQRMRALVESILIVPGLSSIIDDVAQLVRIL